MIGGKKARRLTPEEIDQLRVFSGIRLPMEHIAGIFGMSKDYLEKIIKKDNAAQTAISEGRGSASKNVRGTLYTRAIGVKNKDGSWKIDPDMTAMKFWCSTQEGFKSADRIELTGPGGGAILTATLSDEEREAEIKRLMAFRQLTDDE